MAEPDSSKNRRPRNRDDLTADHVRLILSYAPLSGTLIWKHRDSVGWKWTGKRAGSVRSDGYVEVGIDGHKYMAHRIIWLIMTGSWPKEDVDHRNTNRADNRWKNLRAATGAQNRRYRGSRRNGRLKGAYWNKEAMKWRSAIRANGKQYFLGYFDSEQAAHEAYCTAADELHGEFAHHG